MIDASQRGCLFCCQRSVLTWSREQRTAVYFPTWAGWFSWLFVLLIISETLSFTTSFLLCSMVYSVIWPLISFHSTFQEIALLSQFEHENIVHYFGTDKVSSPIFQLRITFSIVEALLCSILIDFSVLISFETDNHHLCDCCRRTRNFTSSLN